MTLNAKGEIAITSALLSVVALWATFACTWETTYAQTTKQSQDTFVTEAEQAMFIRGQGLYNQGLYGEAIVVLSDFLERYPDSSIRDLAILWLGRSYVGQGDIANAEKAALRLKEVKDTPLADLYDEEVRIARQNFARVTASKRSAREISSRRLTNEVGDTAPGTIASGPRPLSISSEATSSQVTKPSKNEPAPPPLKLPNLPVSSEVTTPVPAPNVGSSPVTLKKTLSSPTTETERTTSVKPFLAPIVSSQLERLSDQKPNDQVQYRLQITNEGMGRATDLTIRLEVDPQLIYFSSELMPIRQELINQRQILTFRLSALEPGQTNSFLLSLQPHNRVSAKTSTQNKHTIFYRDSLGQFHHTP